MTMHMGDALRSLPPLGLRVVMRGVQCVCGHWWPSFKRTDHALRFEAECCGALYEYRPGAGGFSTLSLLALKGER